MTQEYTFLDSNVNTSSMGGDQPDIQGLFRTGGDYSRGTARPNDAGKGIPADGQLWFDSIARTMYIYSITKTGGQGWIPLFEAYDGAMLQSPVNPGLSEAWPKGSVFISSSSVNPGDPTVLGYGQWQLLGQGRSLCGVGTNGSESYTINEGELLGTAFPTLPADALPAHRHNFSSPGLRDRNVLPPVVPITKVRESGTDGFSTGNPANFGQPFTHIPPYSPVYIWVRGTDALGSILFAESSLSATLTIDPEFLGTATQVSVGRGNFINNPICSGGTTPAQSNTPWTAYRAEWRDALLEDNYWTFTAGVEWEVLKTFSFWNVTTDQLLHTFPQGLVIPTLPANTNAAQCVFNLIPDTSAEYHGMWDYVDAIAPLIVYEDDASTIEPQPPSWWGDEIRVIPGS